MKWKKIKIPVFIKYFSKAVQLSTKMQDLKSLFNSDSITPKANLHNQ
jgi:3-methyladenine DNA glycosylase AlkC